MSRNKDIKERGYFTFCKSFWEAIKRLPDGEQLAVFKAVCEYSFTGKEPMQLDITNSPVWILIEPILRNNNKQFINASQKRAKTYPKPSQVLNPNEAKAQPLHQDNNPNPSPSPLDPSPSPEEGKKGTGEKGKQKEKSVYGSFENVKLTSAEFQKLTDKFGSIESAKEKIEVLSTGKAQHGYKYDSDYAAILTWHRSDEKKRKTAPAGRHQPTPSEVEDYYKLTGKKTNGR